MTEPTYDPARTGLLFVDPYNDFLSEGGKLWPRVKEVAEQVGLIENLKAVVKTVREKNIQAGRFAMELGYHVTLITDATAAISQEMMHAAHKLNGPTYAHAILTAAEPIAALQAEPTTVD